MRLVYVSLGWVIGIILVELGGSRTPLLWTLLAVIATLSTWLSWQSRWRWAFVALVALTLGGARAAFLSDESPVAAYNGAGGLTLEGRVFAEPDRRDDLTLLYLRTETVTRAGVTLPVDGDVLVRAPRVTDAQFGDVVHVTGRLETPGVYDTFSYADFLARQNIFTIMDNAVVDIIEPQSGFAPYAWLLRVKSRAELAINRMMPDPEAGLLVGILLGNERGLSPELRADFATTGAAHIIAISGFNMAILAGVVIGILEKSRVQPMASAFIAIIVLLVYTVFVGANAAVLRAAVMSSVLVVGNALRRKSYVPATLAFVVLLMSLQNPRVLWDISFQLSFFATLGLALFADPFSRTFDEGLRRLFNRDVAGLLSAFLSEPIVVTVAALVTTLPLTVLYFNRLSLVQLPVNLLIVPVQTAVLLSGIVATLLVWIAPPVAQIIYWFDMALLHWTVAVVRWFADLPFAEIEFYVDQTLILVFFITLIGGAMIQATQPEWSRRLGNFIRSRAVFSTTILVGITLIALNVGVYVSRPDGNLHVHVLDVGHSNGIFIETPGGAQVLVDGGRFPSRLLTQVGDRIAFNDRQIDLLVITQPDVFQYGALPTLLARYNVPVALTNGQPNQSDEFEALQLALRDTEVINVTAGYSASFDDGTLLEVLNQGRCKRLT